MMYSERIGNELYVYWNGELIYKRWYKRGSTEKNASVLLSPVWPADWIN